MVHSLSVLAALRQASLTVVETFWIFCENSSLHGLRYIGPNKAIRGNILLRFVWSVIAMVSLGFTLLLANSAWDQFRSNPTLTTIETTSYPVSLIAFPSVTLCNINKIHSSKAVELGKQLMELGIPLNDTTDVLYSLPRLNDYRPIDQRIIAIEQLLASKGYDTERLSFEVAPPCETMMIHCFWLMKPVQCRTLFRRTKIFAGYCCSFNADRFLEPNFTRSQDALPQDSIHVTGIGKGEGLSVLMDIGESYYMASNRFSYGIEVYVHRSFDFPDYSDYTTVVQRGTETDVSILPTMVTASPALRNIPLEMRGCAFADEGNITTSVPYTYSNCMNECEMRYIATACRCIPLFRQTVELQAMLQVPICGFRELACLLDLKERVSFTSAQVGNMAGSESKRSNIKCHCYPSCTLEKNEVHTITNTISKPQNDYYTPEFNFSAYGVLHVHFRSTNCLKYRREPFVTWQTLVATFGGILGLCFGGSILSLIEAVFLFGVIPFTVFKAMKNKSKAHPSPTVNAISYVNYPRHQPLGYFRRKEVMARAINNAGAMWGTGKSMPSDNRRWKQHYIDELRIIP
ncbi:sodium channel protein Nach-like [Anopheles marshallii]|uniref:sodium channel protein Nach-like n=1 Tax=Anopheles marshallii TaxID=1521116 RepID=UPI00237A38DC|nr:sodium channel protein Nach-like [Anopheles marshallii]